MNEHRRLGEAELRLALRGLRRDIEADRDLWPGIAARIKASPRAERRAWIWPLATAASLVLAVCLAWQVRPAAPAQPVVAAGPRADASLVQREAEGMTVQYRAALRELDARAIPANWQPGIEALDRSAMQIRAALKKNPDSRLLLERLRDTYTRRLALSRQALYA